MITDQDAEKGLDLYAVLDSYFESWAICSTESPEDRGLAPCQSRSAQQAYRRIKMTQALIG